MGPTVRRGRGDVFPVGQPRNKGSLAADLNDAVARAEVHELVRRADVLVENFRPGTMARYGLSYEEVRRANPGLVYCSVTGFGPGRGAALISDRTRRRPASAWFAELTPLGVPCGPVNDLAGAVAFADDLGLRPVVGVGAGDRRVDLVANPIGLSDSAPDYRLPPPRLGEHTRELRARLASGAGAGRFG